MDAARFRSPALRTGLAALLVGAALSAAPPATAAAAPLYPPDAELTAVADPPLPRPAYLAPIIDPVFGTTITRISDRLAFGRPRAPALRHSYSKRQPWNSDQSLLMLYWTTPAPLLDGSTYELLGWVNVPSETVWMHTDPHSVIGIAGGHRLIRFNVLTGQREILAPLDRYRKVLIGAGEGNLSNDDRYVVLFGSPRGHAHRSTDLLVFDLLERRMISRRRFGRSRINWSDSSTFDNATISQSGRHVILSFARRGSAPRRGIHSYDLDLRDERFLSQHGGGHFDACIDAADRDVMLITGPNGDLITIDLQTGERRTELTGVSWSIHISCRNTDRPGWAYVSEFYERGEARYLNEDEVFALRLDGSGTVERFAHEHYSNREDYPREAHGVPSPDGARVLWASDWGLPRGPIYSYVAEQR